MLESMLWKKNQSFVWRRVKSFLPISVILWFDWQRYGGFYDAETIVKRKTAEKHLNKVEFQNEVYFSSWGMLISGIMGHAIEPVISLRLRLENRNCAY